MKLKLNTNNYKVKLRTTTQYNIKMKEYVFKEKQTQIIEILANVFWQTMNW
jgi:hypothetical protein